MKVIVLCPIPFQDWRPIKNAEQLQTPIGLVTARNRRLDQLYLTILGLESN
jgi:hypothetical protein